MAAISLLQNASIALMLALQHRGSARPRAAASGGTYCANPSLASREGEQGGRRQKPSEIDCLSYDIVILKDYVGNLQHDRNVFVICHAGRGRPALDGKGSGNLLVCSSQKLRVEQKTGQRPFALRWQPVQLQLPNLLIDSHCVSHETPD